LEINLISNSTSTTSVADSPRAIEEDYGMMVIGEDVVVDGNSLGNPEH
jgi:hypothetical protein